MHNVIIIGAGPGGIVATKELLEAGIDDVVCLEKSDRLGGVFSNTYDNLVLTSSVTFSMFSDYWVGEGKGHHFWTKDEAVQYWSDYADHYKVSDRIRFNSTVVSVEEKEDENWQIQLENGDVLECSKLVLAIGNNSQPRYPNWSKKLNNISFDHSSFYRNADSYKNKRVLIVGGGESGSDVAYEIAGVAKESWVSLRESTGWIVPRKRGDHAADVSTHRGIWDLPREFGSRLSPFVLKLERGREDPVFDALADLNDRVKAFRGIWGIYGTKTLALPKAIAHHGCQVVEDIVDVDDESRTLTCSDGRKLENVDAVVFCTGYHNEVTFMPEGLQSCDPRTMYKHMFHPDMGDKLAWIGWARPGFGSQFPIMEMQSRYLGLIWSGKKKLPETDEMQRTIQADLANYVKQFEGNATRIRSLIDYHGYMNQMAKIIGCFPPLMTYFFTKPRLWLHLMYGPTQATQFRLRGPGKKVKLAQEIIRKLPVSTFNHIVKAGIRGRLIYALSYLIPGVSLSRS